MLIRNHWSLGTSADARRSDFAFIVLAFTKYPDAGAPSTAVAGM
jgi:hypothetical protein